MPMMTSGAYNFPEPKSYRVKRMDLDGDNTGRSESGVLTRERIRAGVYQIDVSWRVNKTALKGITDVLGGVSFPLNFFDPTTSSTPTGTFYCGNREAELVSYTDQAHPENSLWELTATITQF